MNILKLLKNLYSNFTEYIKNNLNETALKIVKNKHSNDLIKSIEIYLHIIKSKDFNTVNIGWNSINLPVRSPNKNIAEDVVELLKFIQQLDKFKDERLYCSFLETNKTKVNITKYYLDKNNIFLDANSFNRQLVDCVNQILTLYKKEINDVNNKTSYKCMIITKVLTEVKTTLESLSTMK